MNLNESIMQYSNGIKNPFHIAEMHTVAFSVAA
jgi:hypothetical protein